MPFHRFGDDLRWRSCKGRLIENLKVFLGNTATESSPIGRRILLVGHGLLSCIGFIEMTEARIGLDLRIITELLVNVMNYLRLRAMRKVRHMVTLSHVRHRDHTNVIAALII